VPNDTPGVEDAVGELQRRWRLTHHAAVHLLRFIARAGGRTTSGGRTPRENRRVGGAPGSDHLRGNAWDHVPGRGQWAGHVEWLRADRCSPECNGPRYVANEGDHVHAGGWR